MKLLLESIGESLTEEELFRFMADVDEDGTGEIGIARLFRQKKYLLPYRGQCYLNAATPACA